MRTAVVTTVHGRGSHLRGQLEGLARSTRPPAAHVVVAIGDPGVAEIVSDAVHPTVLLECPSGPTLPVAAARNLGAETALRHGSDLLVFLDVDCVPAADLIERYHDVAGHAEHEHALLCGPVTYLKPPGPGGYDIAQITGKPHPHPARPVPPDGAVVATTDYALFWSLSFAVKRATWQRVGGFCELYRGYGGEDTDFAFQAADRGVPMRWVGGAHAFHQHHPVGDPPTTHLDDILRNASIFHQRWGWWPMEGWLAAFEADGLVRRDPVGRPFRTTPAIASAAARPGEAGRRQ